MPAILATDLTGLAAQLRRLDHDRHLLALFVPADKRDAVRAIYAFNAEIAGVPDRVSEPTLGRIRLQWWREAIAEIFAGGRPRHHELLTPLAAAIAAHGLSEDHFRRLIEARERDLASEPPATLAALEAYAEETSAPLQLLVLEVLGAATPAANSAAREVAIAYALLGLLRAARYRARAGRPVLPQALIEETGLDPDALAAGRSDPGLALVARRIADRAASHLASAREGHAEVAAGFPALLPGVLAAGDLARLRRAGFDLLAPAFARPDPWRIWRLTVATIRRRY
jgi:NADH dehydrogenase [ubiquinone] 1 alpha subcomplex assembly factor 6